MGNASEPAAVAVQPKKSVAENVRETLESIVVAFILAFVFRAFIVEAFIIPTGSMAPTLYGEHLTNTCSTCGYQYGVGVTEQARDRARHSMPVQLRCPNCDTMFDELKPAQIARPDAGDRIVVHKWPFDIGGRLLGPHRWDVVVFKDPRDGTTNFIKRLVGLPGEVIEIIDGDIYTVPVKQLKPKLIESMERLREDVYRHRATPPETREEQRRARESFARRYAEINAQLLPLLPERIERKLPQSRAQESLWFTVYNQDDLPNYERPSAVASEERVQWQPEGASATAAWDAGQREITFKSESEEPLDLKFAGKAIDDFYAYNNDGLAPRESRQYVGDLLLRFLWFPDSGSGGLRLTMNRDQDQFTAEIGIDGRISLCGLQPDSGIPGDRQTLGEKKLAAFAPGRAVDVQFIILDYRVALLIDGQEVIASTDQQYSPKLKKLTRFIEEARRGDNGFVEVSDVKPSEVRIAAWNQQCRLRHVLLQRDVYYRSQRQSDGVDDRGNPMSNPYYLWPGWATAGAPMMLRTGRTADDRHYGAEFFMLGDNSPQSKDSRLWWEVGPHLLPLNGEYQVGTVPEDQLIGKAFFVYWPAGYRSSWLSSIGWIPNVGRMRWIR